MRTNPRISVTKLGEYIYAAPARRRSIVTDQRLKPVVRVARYAQIEPVVADFIGDPARDVNVVKRALARLSAKVPSSTFQEQTVADCIEILLRFLEVAPRLKIPAIAGRRGPRQGGVVIEDVFVSVRPEVLFTIGDDHGAVKLYFSKTHPLHAESGADVATMVRRYLMEEHGVLPPPELCFAVDVSQGAVFTAPRAFKRRLTNIEAACQEIKARWDAA